MRRVWISGLAGSIGVIPVPSALAGGAGSAPEHVEREYTRLEQARLEAESATRERLLTMVLAACKEACQTTMPTIQVQALLGAAQAYLLVQSP